MDKKLAQDLIAKTRLDYNKISDHFSSTRSSFNWFKVARAIHGLGLKPGVKVLDLGCGNGRTLDVLSKFEVDYTGLDLSENLIMLAKKRHPKNNFLASDLLKTPFKNDYFDFILSLATLHHIPGAENRRRAIMEIKRILKPGGKILLTVWYFWDNPDFKTDLIKSTQPGFDQGDFFRPWKDSHDQVLVERFFHAWQKSEMEILLKEAGFTDIKIKIIQENDKNNLIVTAKK